MKLSQVIFSLNLALLAASQFPSSASAFMPELRRSTAPALNVPTPLSDRPPQFVMLAFDGSLNLNFWRESRAFARDLNSRGKNIHFTYFMSGVYFLGANHRDEYDAPVHGRGKSAIGFGGDEKTLPYRVEEVNQALQEGHEMGSHVNGHYDARQEKWTENDWRSELSQFWHLIFDVFTINKVQPLRAQGWLLKKEDVIGFRAPMLGVTPGLWPTLAANGFRYDTSESDKPNYWPQKHVEGIWNIPLAELTIVGTAKRTLSMDYNFFYSQSNGVEDSANRDLYKKQMLDTYRKYFQDNYNGNRAPVNIGHHFSKWNGAAYWEAMQEFATDVCGLPEVRCVTYHEYMDWLNAQTPEKIASYHNGRFQHSQPVRLTDSVPLQGLALNLQVDRLGARVFANIQISSLSGLHLTPEISIDGDIMGGHELDVQTVRDLTDAGDDAKVTARLVDSHGVVVATSSRMMKHVGTAHEYLDPEVLEDRALLGDLPEAHRSEGEGTLGF